MVFMVIILKVLKTIPWEKVDIEVMTIESNHFGEVSSGSDREIQDFLESKGYVLFHTVGIDQVYIRKDLYEGKYKPDMEKLEQFYRDERKNCRIFTNQEKFFNLINEVYPPPFSNKLSNSMEGKV